MSVNKVILVGNVGKDPEIKTFENDIKVANFSLATSDKFTKKGEKVTQTEWHNIVVWRGLAKVAEDYVKKGMLLYIEGSLRTRSWEDQEGNKKYITEIMATNMQMLGKKGDSENVAAQVSSSADSSSEEETDDLPF